MHDATNHLETWALVPVKRFDRAKSRLARAMGQPEREELAWAMVCDVLDTLRAVQGLDGVLVVTGDEGAAGYARCIGVMVLRESHEVGINMAVRTGLDWLSGRGIDGVVIVPGDIPFAAPDEIAVVLSHLRPGSAVLVPASRDGGTNVFAMAPPHLISTAYGQDSFARHLAACRSAGVETHVMRLAGIGHDIDLESDLYFDPKTDTAKRTRALLAPLKRRGSVAL